MNKIGPHHLARSAFVYVRQSTADQLTNNPESRRRQYALETRAKSLGWEKVTVIDDDLGRSGGGTARPGFERLLTAICTGTAGAVFAIEASRLARNGRDWHTLLEFCMLVNCLIIDEDGVYDPKLLDDRLLLGMKGTFSEIELSLLRQRSQEALRLKAARGDLHTCVAVGYVRSDDDRLEMDPDKRVREAIYLVFRKFAEFGSVRQVAIWFCEEHIKVPTIVHDERGRTVEWRLPRYGTIHRLLTNPVYAGAYVFGRTESQVHIEAGRKVITRVRRSQKDWDYLIHDHHAGYITWQDYESHLQTINRNANMKGEMVPGSIRNGSGLLTGLLRCGHCGRKLKVHHRPEGRARYACHNANVNHGRKKCISFGNLRIDAAVSAEVLALIAPLGLDAALQAIADRDRSGTERLEQIELALEQARYEAARAHRQYDAVDPENRLVVGDLERRWNERLKEVARLEDEHRAANGGQPPAVTTAERAELLALATDLPRLWNDPRGSLATRKRVVRAVLEEIVVCEEPGKLRLKLHWKGGDHTTLDVVKSRRGEHRWKTAATTEDLLRDLARVLPDGKIASVLNRLGIRTAKDNTWTQERVRTFRKDHSIAVYREGEREERGELVLHEAAARLGISTMTVTRLIKDGVLPAKQTCVGAPYVIREADLELPALKRAIKKGRALTPDPRQGTMEYQ